MVSAARSMPSSSDSTAPGDQECGAGIEDDDVAPGARFAAQDRLDHPGVLVGRAAGQP